MKGIIYEFRIFGKLYYLFRTDFLQCEKAGKKEPQQRKRLLDPGISGQFRPPQTPG